MNNTPLISVVMPAYNCEKYICQAIDSIIGQTYSNWELLIADDASTDSTRKIIDSYSNERIKVFHNQQNMGYLKTWNKLMILTIGDYITFQDADDWSEKNRFEIMLEFFTQHPEISVCGSNYRRVNSQGDFVQESSFPQNHEAILNAMPQQFLFVGSALMIKRQVYQTIGGYNEFFDMGAEDCYWTYLVLEKFKMENLPQVLYNYRFNPHSVSGNLANNPSKLNVGKILTFLIEDRRKRNTDYLQEGKVDELQHMLRELNKPFLEDTSYYYYYVAKRRFYEGHKSMALKLMCRAIFKNPCKWSYYKDLHYFCTHNISNNE